MQSEMQQRLALTLVLLVPLGIGTKFYAGPAAGWVRGYAGGILYLSLLDCCGGPRAPFSIPVDDSDRGVFRNVRAGVFTALASTDLQTIRQTFLGRALIGTAFDWWDLVHHGVGAVLGALPMREIIRAAPND